MSFYALRTTEAGADLHVFTSRERRDKWTERHAAPKGAVGHREAIDSTHRRVRWLYRGTDTERVTHDTEGEPVRLK